MSGCRIGGEEGLQELSWVDGLVFWRFAPEGKDAVGFQATLGSGSEAYLAKDDQMPERLFCVIVGGWYTRASEESEEKSLFGTHEIGPKGFGGFETKWPYTEAAQFPQEAFFDLGRPMPGDIAGFELLPRVAES